MEKKYKKTLDGMVISDKGNKTIVVSVQRRYKHTVYSKFVSNTKKYYAHDELNCAKVGDKVSIIESRPISKLKRWSLLAIKK